MKMSPNPAKPGSTFKREEAMGEDCKLTEPDDPADCFNRLPLARSGSILRRTSRLLLVAALLLVTTHRLPAPIQEIQESPTPAAPPMPALKVEPAQTPKPIPTPKPKSSKAESAAAGRKRARPEKAAQPTVAQRTGKRFAGTWAGTMHAENGQTYPVTVIVDPTETKVTANGPVFANEEGRIQINGDTLTWNWMLDSWSMTLSSETTAQLVKRYFNSTHTGTVQRTK
jgi:hypothetical protein